MRLLGITISEEKRIEIALTTVFGIGRARAHIILDKAGVDRSLKSKDISTEQENDIRKIVEAYKLEGDLKRETASNVKRLKDIKSYRGVRHSRSMPVRGQRTKTNSRTRRGNVRKTMGTGRKLADKK